MSKRIYFAVFALAVILPAIFYGVQFVSAHSGGGTTAHGDTIDMKITEVWVGPTTSSLNRVFNGSSETVTVTANRTDYIRLDFDLISTSADSQVMVS